MGGMPEKKQKIEECCTEAAQKRGAVSLTLKSSLKPRSSREATVSHLDTHSEALELARIFLDTSLAVLGSKLCCDELLPAASALDLQRPFQVELNFKEQLQSPKGLSVC